MIVARALFRVGWYAIANIQKILSAIPVFFLQPICILPEHVNQCQCECTSQPGRLRHFLNQHTFFRLIDRIHGCVIKEISLDEKEGVNFSKLQ